MNIVLTTLLDAIALAWAQPPPVGSQPSGDIPWWQIVTGILAIPTAILFLWYTFVLSQKTRWETREVKRRILKEEGRPESQNVPIYQDALTSPRLVAASLQDFIVRFLILYLVSHAWGVINGFFFPLVQATVIYWHNQRQLGDTANPGPSWLESYGLIAPSHLQWLGSALIFLLFGVPLLLDVTHAVGGNILEFRRRSRVA